MVGLGHQYFNVLPDQLFSRIAEKPECGGVEIGNRAMAVYGNNAIDGAIDNSPEPSFATVSGSVGFCACCPHFVVGTGCTAHRLCRLVGHYLTIP